MEARYGHMYAYTHVDSRFECVYSIISVPHMEYIVYCICGIFDEH